MQDYVTTCTLYMYGNMEYGISDEKINDGNERKEHLSLKGAD